MRLGRAAARNQGCWHPPSDQTLEFYALDKAHNACHNENVSHLCSIIEAIFFELYVFSPS